MPAQAKNTAPGRKTPENLPARELPEGLGQTGNDIYKIVLNLRNVLLKRCPDNIFVDFIVSVNDSIT